MTAGGNTIILAFGGWTYHFSSFELTFEDHIEYTPLVNGSMYRARSASGRKRMRLKGRLAFSAMGQYSSLIGSFASQARDFTVNGTQYTNWALVTGKLTSDENAQYAECEMILSEVDT